MIGQIVAELRTILTGEGEFGYEPYVKARYERTGRRVHAIGLGLFYVVLLVCGLMQFLFLVGGLCGMAWLFADAIWGLFQ